MGSRMLPVILNLPCMNMVTPWTSKDSENKDTFHITTVSVHRTSSITGTASDAYRRCSCSNPGIVRYAPSFRDAPQSRP